MKIYTREVPGKTHKKNEDSHYAMLLQDNSGREWCLAMVADGLSGYAGTTASHQAVKDAADVVEKTIKGGTFDAAELLRQAVLAANANLEKIGTTYTCLDITLLSRSDGLVAHLGDSRVYLINDNSTRVITPDENLAGVPSNYIGCTYTDGGMGGRIEERINIIPAYGGEHGAPPSRVLLATDGLHSRIPDAAIDQLLRGEILPWNWEKNMPEEEKKRFHQLLRKYREPAMLLELLMQEVMLPGYALSAEEEEHPDRVYLNMHGTSAYGKLKGLSGDELVGQVLQRYQKEEDLALKLDSWKKFDDTTLVLVDLEDSVERELHKLQDYEIRCIPELQGIASRRAEEIVGLRANVASQEEQVASLSRQLAEGQEFLKDKDAKIGQLSAKYARVEGEKAELRERLKEIQKGKSDAYAAMRRMANGFRQEHPLCPEKMENVIQSAEGGSDHPTTPRPVLEKVKAARDFSKNVMRELGKIGKRVLDYAVRD